MSKSPAPTNSNNPRLQLAETKKRGSLLNFYKMDGLLKTEGDTLDSRQLHMTGTESLKKHLPTAKQQKEMDRSKFFMHQLEMQKIKSKS
mmetsp:Transcript_10882/g.16523  ORF Transcript_10882/g.16523 Transcript_10882/m.16523 type:complete len:89 (+) Transcript_10882:6609-6875(+)